MLVTKFLAQLICFRSCKSYRFLPVITLNNTVLQYKDEAIHLGHVLSFDLNDGPDITRAPKDFNRKANCVLCTFHAANCFVKCFLVKLYCLSLYGCCLLCMELDTMRYYLCLVLLYST